jgi:para-nitrobenzyl esterase
VTSYWTNFVKYGNPNSPEGTDYNGLPLPEWKAYRPDEKNVIRFLDKATPGTLAEDKVIDFRVSYAKELFT